MYLATPVTGAEKGRFIRQAVELYLQLFAPGWKLVAEDDRGNDADNAALTFHNLELARPGDVVFGPCGSAASLEFVKKYQKKASALYRKDHYLLNQVTASTRLNQVFPTLNTFFPAQDYLKGVLDLVKAKAGRPGRVHILRNQEIAYLDVLVERIKKNIKRLELTPGEEIVINGQERARVAALLASRGVTAKDWLIILDYGPGEYAGVAPGPIFQDMTKIYTYGVLPDDLPDDDARQMTLRNSWQVLFWWDKVDYAHPGKLSSCRFVEAFSEAFGRTPEFHAAFAFAAMEVAAFLGEQNPFEEGRLEVPDVVPTIMGPIRWDKEGVRVGATPLVYRLDHDLEAKLYLSGDAVGWCGPQSTPTEVFSSETN